MAENKTKFTAVPAAEFLKQIEPERRRLAGLHLDAIFREATGFKPRMWGPSIVGYGSYNYRYVRP